MKNLLFSMMLLVATSAFAQDVLEKRDGSTLLVKVVEITSNDVKYKEFSNTDGPIHTMDIDDILSLSYENGEKETFISKSAPEEQEQVKQTCILRTGTAIPLRIANAVRAADLNCAI